MSCSVKEITKVRVDEKVELAYEFISQNDKEKPILIFLHEGLGSIAQWKNFPKEVCQALDMNGLVYERYGYGHSTAFFDQRQANYLYKEADYYLPLLIQKLALEKKDVILFGHSDGGSIALIYAALFPENVNAVISVAAHVFVDELSIKAIREMDELYAANDDFKNRLKKYHFDHVDSTFFAWSKVWLTEEFAKFNMEHLLPKIIAPILAIQGTQDEYGLPSQVESIVTNGANSNNEQLFIDNTKHSPHVQAKEEVLTALNKFLKRTLNNE